MSKRKLPLACLVAVLAISALAAGSALAATANKRFGSNQNGRPSGGELSARPENFQNPPLSGTAEAVSGMTITLTGKSGFGQEAADATYTVDASNATVKKMARGADGQSSETTISVSDIQVGDTLMIQGEVSGTSVAATSISVSVGEKMGAPPAGARGGYGYGYGGDGKAPSPPLNGGDQGENADIKQPAAKGNGYGYGQGQSGQKANDKNQAAEENNDASQSAASVAKDASVGFWSKIFSPVRNFFSKIFSFKK